MSRNVERIVGFVLVLIFSTLFFITGREGANTTIDDAQATAAALQNTVNELLDIPDPPDLSAELAEAQAALDAANTQVAELLTEAAATEVTTTVPAVTPTLAATVVPTEEFCYPYNLDEVVVIRDPRASLFEATSENLAGKPIMGVYTDSDGNRVQYSIGETFFIYEDLVVADGGLEFYEVFGPRGKGLYIRADHIKLFNADPDVLSLYPCTD